MAGWSGRSKVILFTCLLLWWVQWKAGLSWASLSMSCLSGYLDFFPLCSGLQEQMFPEMGRDDCQPVGPGPGISTGHFHSILLVIWSHSPWGSKGGGIGFTSLQKEWPKNLWPCLICYICMCGLMFFLSFFGLWGKWEELNKKITSY